MRKIIGPLTLGWIIQLPFLLLAWVVLYYWMLGLTEGLLVPWDIHPGRPPVGTIARTVNDFFEVKPGMFIPAWLVLSTSAVLFIYRLIYRPSRSILLEFIVTSLYLPVFFMAVIGLLILLTEPTPYTDGQIGFTQKIPGMVVTVLLLLLMFWFQWSGKLGSFVRKRSGT